MPNKNKIEITESNLRNIFKADFPDFEKNILENVYCANCSSSYGSVITDFRIFLNDLNDVILEGFCKNCDHPVARYVETGEVEKYLEPIKKIKKILEELTLS